MMEDRQSSRKKQNSGQAQSSRKEQTGRQEQARETKEAIRVLGRVIRYMAANYKLAVTAVLACIIVSVGPTGVNGEYSAGFFSPGRGAVQDGSPLPNRHSGGLCV